MYKLVDDIIYYKGMIYLVPEYKFKKKALQAFHDSLLAGHWGFSRLINILEKASLGESSGRTLLILW
jgi:hypothetical protein